MTPWLRTTAAVVAGKTILPVVLVMTVCAWCAAAEIYWVALQVPRHGESAAAVLVGVDVVYSWLVVSSLSALLRDLEALRIPQLRPLLTASLVFILALVFVTPCLVVWLLGGAGWDLLFMAMGSVVGTAGPLLWRSVRRARTGPVAHLSTRTGTVRSAQGPQPWRAVRMALGAPYAPESWPRRVLELALVGALLAGTPLLVWFFEGSLSPQGFPSCCLPQSS